MTPCCRRLLGLASALLLALFTGCAINPVTGERQLMLVSEDQEIAIDRQNAPQQFSQDYGPVQQTDVSAYVNQVGMKLARQSDRPNMPFSFRVVNASYLNAYAFQGGSIAVTRGMMLAVEDEATLAALLGHEIGHVCARHGSNQMSKGMLIQAAAAGVVAGVGYGTDNNASYVQAATMAANAGGTMLLAKYSRDDEREADALGMKYSVGNGYTPLGMIRLTDILVKISNNNPSMVEQLMATHPQSPERYAAMVNLAQTKYAHVTNGQDGREAYQKAIAPLLPFKATVQAIQEGDALMGQNNLQGAYAAYGKALQNTPKDYEALLKMSQCCLAMNKADEAKKYADLAKQAYPQEPQAAKASGLALLGLKQYGPAYSEFQSFDRAMPGGGGAFLCGYAAEQGGNLNTAAQCYQVYLQRNQGGAYTQHANQRLQQWTYQQQQLQQQQYQQQLQQQQLQQQQYQQRRYSPSPR